MTVRDDCQHWVIAVEDDAYFLIAPGESTVLTMPSHDAKHAVDAAKSFPGWHRDLSRRPSSPRRFRRCLERIGIPDGSRRRPLTTGTAGFHGAPLPPAVCHGRRRRGHAVRGELSRRRSAHNAAALPLKTTRKCRWPSDSEGPNFERKRRNRGIFVLVARLGRHRTMASRQESTTALTWSATWPRASALETPDMSSRS